MGERERERKREIHACLRERRKNRGRREERKKDGVGAFTAWSKGLNPLFRFLSDICLRGGPNKWASWAGPLHNQTLGLSYFSIIFCLLLLV